MGKAKKTKKHRAVDSGDIYIDQNRTGSAHQFDQKETLSLSELEANLGALEEVKRKQACALLADLYHFNIHNHGSLDALASKKVLMKLGMRLIDHSLDVKVSASLALKNLTDCGDKAVLVRVVGFGMFRTAITLVLEAANAALDDQALFVVQNLLYVIANILTTHPEAGVEISKHNAAFVTFLFSSFAVEGVKINLLNTIANVVNALTKTNCLALVGETDMQNLQSRLNQLVAGKVSVSEGRVLVHEVVAEQYDNWVIVLQLLEIILTCHTRGVAASVLAHVMPFQQALAAMTAMLSAVLADPSLTQSPVRAAPAAPTAPISTTTVEQGMEMEDVDMQSVTTIQSVASDDHPWALSLADVSQQQPFDCPHLTAFVDNCRDIAYHCVVSVRAIRAA